MPTVMVISSRRMPLSGDDVPAGGRFDPFHALSVVAHVS
jgi:hypothetical protein